MQIAILLFDRLTALDAIGPYEVLSRLPGVKTKFVAITPGPKKTDAGLTLIADSSLSEVTKPEIVLIPGGIGSRTVLKDEKILDWIRKAHQHSQWTTSVCTGSLILAAAGILKSLKATTHWNQMERLAEFGAIPVQERVIFEGKVVTAVGVSAGIDMALCLVQKIAGDQVAQAIQLALEYDPHPPFQSGSPKNAPADIVAMVRLAFEKIEK